MRSTTVIATALAAAAPSLASIQAAQTLKGNAVVVNKCSYPLYMWSVDQINQPSEADYVEIAAGSTYREPLRVPSSSVECGVSLKLSKTKKNTDPIAQFEYTVPKSWLPPFNRYITYDISFVDCAKAQPSIAAVGGYDFFSGSACPAWSEGISIEGTGSSCEAMDCAAGSFCPKDAYFEPEPAHLLLPQPVKRCADGDLTSDIIFTACTNGDSGESSDPQPYSSQAAPSSTPTPSPSSSSSSSSTPTPSPSSSSSSSSSSTPSHYSAPAPYSSAATPSVIAAEFAPVGYSSSSSSSSSATPTPQITSAPVITAAIYTEVVYTTVETTMYVDTSGVRVNQDGSKYYGRRFAA